jgi:hypothetical protein
MIISPVFALGSLFRATDRCDRCSAGAKVLALLHTGGELYFCGYHARMHRSVLERVADCFEDPPMSLQDSAA